MKTILSFKNSKVSLRMVLTKKRLCIQFFNPDKHLYQIFIQYHHNEYVTCYQHFQLLVADSITQELFYHMGVKLHENL